MTVLVTDGVSYWAKTAPERPAIVFDGTDTVDYRTLDRWTDAAAHLVAQSGVVAGDRVAIIGDNAVEWVVAAIGALKVGAVIVPLNNRFTSDELRYLIEDSGPRLVLTDECHRDRAAVALDGRETKLIGLSEFTGLRESDPEPVSRLEAGADDVTQIIYTSGTSSRPKGVIFTHRSTFDIIAVYGLSEPVLRPGARQIYVLSMSGAPGLLAAFLHPFTRGMSVYYEKGFDASTTLERLVDSKIDMMASVPVMLEQIAKLPEFATSDLSGLGLVTVAGARVPAAAARAWLDKGVVLRQAYGMTEFGGLTTVNPPEQALQRPDSIGQGTVFTRHRVVRPDGVDCDPEEAGEIIVSGPSMTPGYWGNTQAYSDAVRNGWFHTGDVGVRDTEGFIRIVDRLKDIIITGGYNVAPSEIEVVIYEMPGVVEVCVISMDDPKFGEAPAAIVYADRDLAPEDVTTFCKERLAGYKVPRHVVVRDTPLIRMASGKIARRQIRAEYPELVAPGQPGA